MATGADHYREAERLLAVGAGQRGSELDAICTAAAQVHATLANVAAIADLFALYGQVGGESKEAWRKVLVGDAATPAPVAGERE